MAFLEGLEETLQLKFYYSPCIGLYRVMYRAGYILFVYNSASVPWMSVDIS